MYYHLTEYYKTFRNNVDQTCGISPNIYCIIVMGISTMPPREIIYL